MRAGQWIVACGIAAAVAAGLRTELVAQEVPALVDKQLPGLLTTYKGIHTAPELSHHEAQTSALLADELRKAGYTVTEHVGKYPDGTPAIVQGTSGKGWVILCGVHPEAPENWRRGMNFTTPASVANAYAGTLIDAALQGTWLPHY